MSTIHKITPENPPEFTPGCWLYCFTGTLFTSGAPGWIHFDEPVNANILSECSHWHPDQPKAPTERPEQFEHVTKNGVRFTGDMELNDDGTANFTYQRHTSEPPSRAAGETPRCDDIFKAMEMHSEGGQGNAARLLARTLERELTAAKAEIERLTDSMSWSEAKAHEDAANLRVEVERLTLERDEAIKQQRLAWERHAEKDCAYGEALEDRDEARRQLAASRPTAKQVAACKEAQELGEEMEEAFRTCGELPQRKIRPRPHPRHLRRPARQGGAGERGAAGGQAMKLTFHSPSVSGDFSVPDELAGFFLWLAEHRDDPRAASLLVLVAEYDRETNAEEKQNIQRTINELLENTPIDQ